MTDELLAECEAQLKEQHDALQIILVNIHRLNGAVAVLKELIRRENQDKEVE